MLSVSLSWWNRLIYSFGLHNLCAKIEFPFWMFDWSCTQMIEAVYGAFISCRWVQAYKPGEWNPSRSWQQSKLKKCLWHICYVIISTDGHRSRLGIPDMITWYNMVFETWLPRELVSHLFYSVYNQTFEVLTKSVTHFREFLPRDHRRNNARCILTVTIDKCIYI